MAAMKASSPLLFIAVSALFPMLAAAAPVKCVDEKGKVLYIDEADVGALKCQPVTGSIEVVPHDQPKQQPTIQPDRSLEEKRARVAAAEQRLNEAKAQLADQESYREGNEKNYARVLERLKPYQDAVDAAQKELDRVKAEP